MIKPTVTISVRDINKLVKNINGRQAKARKIASLNTISTVRTSFKKFIIPEIIKAVVASNVFRGIMGDFAGQTDGSDLQAEFGLTNSDSRNFKTELINSLKTGSNIVIEKVTNFQNTKSSTKASFGINPYNPSYDENVKSFSSGSHPAKKDGTGEDINWLEWTMEDVHNVDSLFRITYNLTDSLQKMSRSGRAAMIKAGSYELPIQLKPTIGRNWIEEAIIKKGPTLRRAMDATLRKTLRQNMTKALKAAGFK